MQHVLYCHIFKDDFILGIHKALSGVTISGIASSYEASGIMFVSYAILDDKGTPFELQIDTVFHLKQVPHRLSSPQILL